MPVPDYQSLMLPVLQAVSDGKVHSTSDIYAGVATAEGLSEDDLAELVPSGSQTTFVNRATWAVVYLTKAGLLKRPKRAHYEITERGREAIASGLDRITVKYLGQYPEFVAFKKLTHPKKASAGTGGSTDDSDLTPSDMIEAGYETLRAELGLLLIEQVMACSPAFFERLVVDLLVAMGYGGSRADAGKAVGKSGDGGIDGIIKEDRLGLDAVYIQAKRWENVVGSDRVMAFADSLEGVKASKGVIITTSHFSPAAYAYVEKIGKRIVLIDGPRLAELMMDHGIGVTEEATYSVKKLDGDYFEIDAL